MTNQELLEVSGSECVAALRRAAGGTTIRIPVNPATLVKKLPEIEPQAASLLCKRAGGDLVYIGNGKHEKRLLRDARVRVEKANGKSVAEIALAYDLSERHVRRILNGD